MTERERERVKTEACVLRFSFFFCFPNFLSDGPRSGEEGPQILLS